MRLLILFLTTILFTTSLLNCVAQYHPIPNTSMPESFGEQCLCSYHLVINPKQMWTPTGIFISKKVWFFGIGTSGEINAGQGHGTCLSTPDGVGLGGENYYQQERDSTSFPFPLKGWSLIGKVGPEGKAFYVGSTFQMPIHTFPYYIAGAVVKSLSEPYIINDSIPEGELFLGVNDNDYNDNSGSWQSNITVMTVGSGTYPQPGDVTGITFHPQQQTNWCWAAVAELLMSQANKEDVLQCTQVTKVIKHNTYNCCNGLDKSCNIASFVEKSLDEYNFTYSHVLHIVLFPLTENEIVNEIKDNRPIAVEIAIPGSAVSHYEVIYGYSYIGSKMYIRIWDPQLPHHFRCELYETFPAPIGGKKYQVRSVVYHVKKTITQ